LHPPQPRTFTLTLSHITTLTRTGYVAAHPPFTVSVTVSVTVTVTVTVSVSVTVTVALTLAHPAKLTDTPSLSLCSKEPADPNRPLHFHAFLKTNGRVDVRKTDVFDVKGRHPNIRTISTDEYERNAVLYVRKVPSYLNLMNTNITLPAGWQISRAFTQAHCGGWHAETVDAR
jgi:hypothetical protein